MLIYDVIKSYYWYRPSDRWVLVSVCVNWRVFSTLCCSCSKRPRREDTATMTRRRSTAQLIRSKTFTPQCFQTSRGIDNESLALRRSLSLKQFYSMQFDFYCGVLHVAQLRHVRANVDDASKCVEHTRTCVCFVVASEYSNFFPASLSILCLSLLLPLVVLHPFFRNAGPYNAPKKLTLILSTWSYYPYGKTFGV